MSDVVECAARAVLAYERWRRSDKGARKPPMEREKGEATPRFPGPTADEIVGAVTDDVAEQCRILHAANERAQELRQEAAA